MLIPLDRLLFKEPVAAGMDIYTVAALAKFYRTCNEHTVPIEVRAEGDNWRILDGRHRVVASIMAGRKEVLAELEH